MSQVVVVGGGITGLFCAYYLAREGVSVTLIEEGELGEGSVHAAGLIEPTTFYQINNSKYLRDALSFARRGVLRFRSVNPSWLLSYIRHFGEPLKPEDTELLSGMSEYSIAEYRRLGEETPPGAIPSLACSSSTRRSVALKRSSTHSGLGRGGAALSGMATRVE